MTAWLYTFDKKSGQWCFNDLLPTEEAAREKGRLLWRAGAQGIKIDVIKTVVENVREGVVSPDTR